MKSRPGGIFSTALNFWIEKRLFPYLTVHLQWNSDCTFIWEAHNLYTCTSVTMWVPLCYWECHVYTLIQDTSLHSVIHMVAKIYIVIGSLKWIMNRYGSSSKSTLHCCLAPISRGRNKSMKGYRAQEGFNSSSGAWLHDFHKLGEYIRF